LIDVSVEDVEGAEDCRLVRRRAISLVEDEEVGRRSVGDDIFDSCESPTRERTVSELVSSSLLKTIATTENAPQFRLLINPFHPSSTEHHLHSQLCVVARLVEER
jgi:hypothetical protein